MHHAGSEQTGIRLWMHPVNHVGTDLPPLQIAGDPKYLEEVERDYLIDAYWHGYWDHGHNFYAGLWLMATLTGDPYIREAAEHLTDGTARYQANDAELWWGFERDIGYPLSSIVAAYRMDPDPYILNACRILVQAAQEHQYEETGAWPGSRSWSAAVLISAGLRYLGEESRPRPELRGSLAKAASWITDFAFIPEIASFAMTGPGKLKDVPDQAKEFQRQVEAQQAIWKKEGEKGLIHKNLFLPLEAVAFAYQETGDVRFLDYFHDFMALRGRFPATAEDAGKYVASEFEGAGKYSSAILRQTIFGFARMAQAAPDFLEELRADKPYCER